MMEESTPRTSAAWRAHQTYVAELGAVDKVTFIPRRSEWVEYSRRFLQEGHFDLGALKNPAAGEGATKEEPV